LRRGKSPSMNGWNNGDDDIGRSGAVKHPI